MKYLYLFLSLSILTSCGSVQIRKKSDSYASTYKKPSTKTITSTSKIPKTISSGTTSASSSSHTNISYSSVVNTAKNYIGTPYRSGGTSSNGMDCSGLVVTSFKENGKDLPRISRDQANAGKSVSINQAMPGDLIFFNTSGSGISHVGIVESIKNGEVFFIHSSTSKGVMISSLENSYWKPRFVKIVRVN